MAGEGRKPQGTGRLSQVPGRRGSVPWDVVPQLVGTPPQKHSHICFMGDQGCSPEGWGCGDSAPVQMLSLAPRPWLCSGKLNIYAAQFWAPSLRVCGALSLFSGIPVHPASVLGGRGESLRSSGGSPHALLVGAAWVRRLSGTGVSHLLFSQKKTEQQPV